MCLLTSVSVDLRSLFSCLIITLPFIILNPNLGICEGYKEIGNLQLKHEAESNPRVGT